MSELRYARQYVLAEIGTGGQARLLAASTTAGRGDARAAEIAQRYVVGAGMRRDDAGLPLDVASPDEVARVAGRPELAEAAAFLLGALAATTEIARVTGAPARAVALVPTLSG